MSKKEKLGKIYRKDGGEKGGKMYFFYAGLMHKMNNKLFCRSFPPVLCKSKTGKNPIFWL